MRNLPKLERTDEKNLFARDLLSPFARATSRVYVTSTAHYLTCVRNLTSQPPVRNLWARATSRMYAASGHAQPRVQPLARRPPPVGYPRTRDSKRRYMSPPATASATATATEAAATT